MAGLLEEAERSAEDARVIAEESGQPEALAFYAGQLINIRFEQGRLGELEPLIALPGADQPGDPRVPGRAGAGARRGGHAGRGQSRCWRSTPPRSSPGCTYDSNWLAGMAIHAEACALLDRPSGGRLRCTSCSLPWVDHVAFNSATTWGLVERHVGNLERVLGRHDHAEQSLRRAAERHAAMAGAAVAGAHAPRPRARPARATRGRRRGGTAAGAGRPYRSRTRVRVGAAAQRGTARARARARVTRALLRVVRSTAGRRARPRRTGSRMAGRTSGWSLPGRGHGARSAADARPDRERARRRGTAPSRPLPEYVDYGALMTPPAPFRSLGTTLDGFWAQADPDRLQALCRKVFAAPSADKVTARPIGHHVMLDAGARSRVSPL